MTTVGYPNREWLLAHGFLQIENSRNYELFQDNSKLPFRIRCTDHGTVTFRQKDDDGMDHNVEPGVTLDCNELLALTEMMMMPKADEIRAKLAG